MVDNENHKNIEKGQKEMDYSKFALKVQAVSFIVFTSLILAIYVFFK